MARRSNSTAPPTLPRRPPKPLSTPPTPLCSVAEGWMEPFTGLAAPRSFGSASASWPRSAPYPPARPSPLPAGDCLPNMQFTLSAQCTGEADSARPKRSPVAIPSPSASPTTTESDHWPSLPYRPESSAILFTRPLKSQFAPLSKFCRPAPLWSTSVSCSSTLPPATPTSRPPKKFPANPWQFPLSSKKVPHEKKTHRRQLEDVQNPRPDP